MTGSGLRTCIAFDQSKKVARGPVLEVALKLKEHLKKHPKASFLIFDEATSEAVEVDLRGSPETILRRLTEAEEASSAAEKKPASGPGRPKLGVTAKEVTLLPEHWEWLARQPGGASVTLRRLVEEAKKKNLARDQIRRAQEVTHKFMTAMAGDLPHYEDALRALYAKDTAQFSRLIAVWPKDIREHVQKLAARVF